MSRLTNDTLRFVLADIASRIITQLIELLDAFLVSLCDTDNLFCCGAFFDAWALLFG